MELHAALESLPRSLAVRELGAVAGAQIFIGSYEQSSFRPATDDPREPVALETVVRWLEPRIEQLASLPTQLTHGDWIPPNLKVRGDGWGDNHWRERHEIDEGFRSVLAHQPELLLAVAEFVGAGI